MADRFPKVPVPEYAPTKHPRMKLSSIEGMPTILVQIIDGKQVRCYDKHFWVNIEASVDWVEDDIRVVMEFCSKKLKELHKKSP